MVKKMGRLEFLPPHGIVIFYKGNPLQGKFHFNFLAGICVQHVDGAAQSGVVGAYQAPDIHRIVHIRYGHADQGLFNGASLAHVIPGVGVPDGG